ncbi:MAG: PilZ domain-containing protein [Desulforhopalus sp.]
MSNDIISIVNAIPDRQPSTVTLTDSAGKRIQLSCVFKEAQSPTFFLLFPAGSIPENIEKDWRCIFFSRDTNDESVTFAAQITDLPNNRVIELMAKNTIRPEDLREYFRVNLKTQMAVFYDPEETDAEAQPLELEGMTVDISQTGVLTILSDECKITEPVMLELNLPNPAETVICSGSVVRSKRIRKDRWLTAFHFDNISSKSREIIAKNCFAEQRRQLRENIQTAG